MSGKTQANKNLTIKLSSELGGIVLNPSSSKLGVFQPTQTGVRFANYLIALNQRKKIYVKGASILDIGCGVGLLGITAAKLGGRATCVDIHEDTNLVVNNNALLNKVNVDSLSSDVFSNVVDNNFDIIVCNPPLMITEQDPNGRYVLDEVLRKFRDYTSIGGKLLIYETSNVCFERTAKVYEEAGLEIIERRIVFVCLNRPDFWPLYSMENLEGWVRRSLAYKRGRFYFLRGRFTLFQAAY